MPRSITNALTVDFEDWYQGLEIPHTDWSGYEERVAVSGARLLRLFAEARARATFWEVDPEHPRIPLPLRIALTHYVNLAATERRMKRLLADFAFAPMREVLGVD